MQDRRERSALTVAPFLSATLLRLHSCGDDPVTSVCGVPMTIGSTVALWRVPAVMETPNCCDKTK